MAISERIRFIRNPQGITQKYMGMAIDFPERTTDIRIAQHESGKRKPKVVLTDVLASALEVSPLALNVPDIDSYYGLCIPCLSLRIYMICRLVRLTAKCVYISINFAEHPI